MKQVMTDLRPEVKLLLCCARTGMDPENYERMRALLGEELDWFYLLRAALRHGMTPLLYWHLRALCPEAVPQQTLDYLTNYFHANARRNLFRSAKLHRILKLFETRGIDVVPFKGPVLAASLYGNLALRNFDDLDLLVKKSDVPAARELLMSLEYRPQLQLTGPQERSFRESQCQYLFENDETGVSVELHWAIAPKFFSFPLKAETLWQHLGRDSLGGSTILTLSPEDLLLVLCVHGAKHLWDRLAWICDVAELVRSQTRLDWDLVTGQALRLGSARILFLGLYLANKLLETPLPKEISKRVQADLSVIKLADQVCSRLSNGSAARPGVAESWLFHLRVRERFRDRVRYSFFYTVIPTAGDWALFSPPRSLSFLNYLLRPIRVLGKYGLGLGKLPSQPDLSVFDTTRMEVVQRQLALAQVRPDDLVYDLGCGDGRVVIMAARHYGARGVGVDIDPNHIAESKANARQEGVEHLVRFVQQDAKTIDLSPATVVILYLTWAGNLALRPMLQQQLRPGARIVSHEFGMGDWAPHRVEIVADGDGVPHMLYLWRIEEKRRLTSAPRLDPSAVSLHRSG